MIKGCSKRMIMLKDTGSDLFEEAYFVLKTRRGICNISTERDFIEEANRIINEAACGGSEKYERLSSGKKFSKRLFLYGFFAGSVISFTAAYLLQAAGLLTMGPIA